VLKLCPCSKIKQFQLKIQTINDNKELKVKIIKLNHS
jgi:hypothetical protein